MIQLKLLKQTGKYNVYLKLDSEIQLIGEHDRVEEARAQILNIQSEIPFATVVIDQIVLLELSGFDSESTIISTSEVTPNARVYKNKFDKED